MATVSQGKQLEIPLRDQVINGNGYITRIWLNFLNLIKEYLEPLGYEKHSDIVNNTTTSANVEGLSFNSDKVSHAIVDYFIQRITTGGGAQELVESGTLHLMYRPTSNDWVIYKASITSMPSSGITFSISSTGQVKYTSSNITGTQKISKISYRARTMGAKSQLYSKVGL